MIRSWADRTLKGYYVKLNSKKPQVMATGSNAYKLNIQIYVTNMKKMNSFKYLKRGNTDKLSQSRF